MNARRTCDAEGSSRHDAGDVRPVAAVLRRRRIAIVSVLHRGPITASRREVADPVCASLEFTVRTPHARIDHVNVNAGAVASRIEAPVERERLLIDAIQAPGDLSGALEGSEDTEEAGEAENEEHGGMGRIGRPGGMGRTGFSPSCLSSRSSPSCLTRKSSRPV